MTAAISGQLSSRARPAQPRVIRSRFLGCDPKNGCRNPRAPTAWTTSGATESLTGTKSIPAGDAAGWCHIEPLAAVRQRSRQVGEVFCDVLLPKAYLSRKFPSRGRPSEERLAQAFPYGGAALRRWSFSGHGAILLRQGARGK